MECDAADTRVSSFHGHLRRVKWLALVVAGCGVGSSPRADFLVNTLAVDNYVYARRDPELVALKFRKMQRDPYLWLRGTAAVWWHDATDPG
ncbi:MAG: DUF2252 family protein, partial [Kofleriaceae bacterium]